MDRVRLTRLRWRLRGAWQWPVFAACVLVEAVLLNRLPVWGDGPGGFVPGLLLAFAFNLVVVAILAPFAAMILRRRRRDLPRAIASDYCGTALMGVLLTVLIFGGIGHRGTLVRDDADRASSLRSATRFLHDTEPQTRPMLTAMTLLKVETGFYRGCVPATELGEATCVFVDTGPEPDDVRRDPEGTPNEQYGR